jgi:hypothetical protein
MRLRITATFVVALGLIGCASRPQNVTDTRQSVRRKPVPNLDRKYDWGSMPPPGPMRTHSAD